MDVILLHKSHNTAAELATGQRFAGECDISKQYLYEMQIENNLCINIYISSMIVYAKKLLFFENNKQCTKIDTCVCYVGNDKPFFFLH